MPEKLEPEIVTLEGQKFIKFGEWLFDVFECTNPSGDLGITVYEPGSNPMDDTSGDCTDIYIDRKLKVNAI